VFVEAVNGKIWNTANSCITSKIVFNHLQRIGKVELPEFEPILGSENSFTETKWNFLFRTADGWQKLK
jgi:hypothetical protein